MHSYDIVLFDMDGTLIDSGTAHYEMFERFWPQSPENTGIDLIKKNAGPTIYDVLKPMGITKDEMGRIYDELTVFYQTKVPDIVRTLHFVPDAGKVLTNLRAKGVKTALVSNSHWALVEEIVRENKAAEWFDVVSGSTANQEDKRGRLESVIQNLGITEDKALYVGDNESDARTAQAIGIDGCILLSDISWAKDMDVLMRDIRPTYTVYSLTKLENIVL